MPETVRFPYADGSDHWEANRGTPVLRYALFITPGYYPSGGWDDYVDSFTLVENARWLASVLVRKGAEDWHIVDMETGKIIDHGAGDDK